MTDIPEDIRKAAAKAHAAFARSGDTRNLGDIIAEAIAAEREHCAKIADEQAGEWLNGVEKAKDIPGLNYAVGRRHEAVVIAKAIRGDS